ncbi:MAG TPA: porin family protein [Candidatus Kapabacteria bacterium]
MRKVLFLIAFLAVSTISFSQEESESMSYRITGGLNFAYMKEVPPVLDAFSNLGFMVGINGNLGSHLFFQPGLQFTSYGSAVVLPESGATETSRHEMRANYIRVPLQVGLRLFDPSTVLGIFPFNLEVRGGVSGSYLVGYSDKVTSGSDAPIMKSDVEPFRTALVVGAGVRLVFLSLGVEYEYGLSKFFKNIDDSKLNAFFIVIGGYL